MEKHIGFNRNYLQEPSAEPEEKAAWRPDWLPDWCIKWPSFMKNQEITSDVHNLI